MAKRFINPDWKALRKLSEIAQRSWFYIWDKCDESGVYHYDQDYISIDLKNTVSFEVLATLPECEILPGERILIKNFLFINFTKLKPDYNPHKAAFRCLEKNKLFLNSSFNQASLKLEEEDKDEDKDEDKRGCGGKPYVTEKENMHPPLPAIMQQRWINALRGKYVSMPQHDMPVMLEILNFIFEQETGTKKSFADYEPEETEMVLYEWQKWIDWYIENGKQRSLDTIINKFKMMQEIYLQTKNGKHAANTITSNSNVRKFGNKSAGFGLINDAIAQLERGTFGNN